ncbi:MAG TPA: hypothetical protein VF338_05150, partial [Leptolinea sp.]
MNSNPTKNSLNYPSIAKIGTIVYLFVSVFFFLAYYDLYQGYILIGNPPSLESKRFVVFWIMSIFPIAAWGYGLYLAIRGVLPGKLKSH